MNAPIRYAGIGSRSAPEDVLRTQYELGRVLALAGAELFSGHADGSDLAFENGAIAGNGKRKIFLPWRGFNGSDSPLFASPSPRALEIAEANHPGWRFLKPAARKLHARNTHQVLDESLDNPVDATICWTPDGAESAAETTSKTGGTGSAIRLSSHYGVPVFNLARAESRHRLQQWLAERGISIDLGGKRPEEQRPLL